MVGVPGRVVTSRRQGQEDVQARLDHHLLPDPVARSISCLVDRIDQLERELALLRGQTPPHSDDGHCRTCSAGDLCCEQVDAAAPQVIEVTKA